jgi:signal transduction histidine kinase
LEDVNITDELARRPSRPPDYALEAEALRVLTHEVATYPQGALQALAETVIRVCRADSGGVSVVEPDGAAGIVRWYATAGEFAQSSGGARARVGSPDGDAIEGAAVVLLDRCDRFYPALKDVKPPLCETLLAPWFARGERVGTIWAIAHRDDRHFDAEDARMLARLAGVAAAAWRTLEHSAELSATVASLRDAERTIAGELQMMARLHAMTGRIVRASDLDTLLDEVVEAMMELLGADFGNVQLYDARNDVLTLKAHRGFDDRFLEHFKAVRPGGMTACGLAFEKRRTVVMEDVEREPAFAPNLAASREAGYRSVVSTPLIAISGEPLGMLSTHFRQPRRFSERDLRVATVIARFAADAIDRIGTEEVLRERVRDVELRVADRTAALAGAQTGLEAAARERNRLLRRLASSEEAERRRLSRELHDGVGQHLTAIGLGLKTLYDGAERDSPVAKRVADLQAVAAALARELHSLAVQLRPRALDDFGLDAALTAYAEEWSQRSGIPMDVLVTDVEPRLPELIESALYRITQEALTNVARHSRATHASLVVERRGDDVVLVVEDNGLGFEPVPNRPTGIGLPGIAERAALLGGTLEIESPASGGTTLFVRIPTSDGSTPRARGRKRGDGDG